MKKYVTLLSISLLTLVSCSKDDSTDPVIANDCLLIDYDEFSDTPANQLIGRLEFQNPIRDLWGYEDEANGEEYVLVGFGSEGTVSDATGIYIVNVSNPAAPSISSTIANIGGWDIKTHHNYMYSVNGIAQENGKIVDIENPDSPVVVGDFPGAHNIFITCNGLLVLSDDTFGLAIYDLNEDPVNPKSIWLDKSDGAHESAVLSNLLYDFHGFEGTNIYDLSDPSAPVLLSTITSDLIRFHHSGWVNEDETILIINDERPGGGAGLGDDFTIWDISDKAEPKLLSKFRDLESTIHNVHIIKNKAYFSYYSAGYRVFDISSPAEPDMIYEFDTDPDVSGKGFFLGAFGVYGLSPSGNVFISDVNNGLFIFGQ